ncbi:Na(+)/H(+) antiporter subunit C [Actinorugispora endophytica]|uniref:Multicomponent Na+:H+ antiporter subunit C n=1 Tax=Actinorugispora endophytica TaxID=1605990 RepID=A0A4R6URP1_9ACTN|nr:Na(+)/H(+) antiporter subunit C [Actinorugispora endophytica]TDQ49978.1 multicomponent Na+:H+ antiporter subunit C [Actinorugispora endophytica]
MNDTPTILLVVVVGVLVAAGVALLLERSLTRILLGVILLGNGVNLMILSTGGAAGGPPLLGLTPVEEMSDPLPQAMILTAIVITLGVTAFLLAMAYRSWQLQGHDEVQDDAEDRRISTGGERRELRRRIREQRRGLYKEIKAQRSDLKARIAAEDRREEAERAEIREQLAAAQRDLDACLSDDHDDETRQRYIDDRTEGVRATIEKARGRVRASRHELASHLRADKEAERRQRKELRRRIRAQKRQVRSQIRAERERLARAEDSDLQGAD